MKPNVKMIIEGQAKDLGDNFVVRRVLPYRKQRLVGPFIFWDHMGPTTFAPEQNMLVRSHPHIGLSTITYLFAGQILHRDSLNNELFIKPGEVNWMTSGRGITHSERCEPRPEPMDLEGIQVWVALPKEAEDIAPSFVHHKENDLPTIKQSGFDLHLIAGEAFGEKSPLPVYSPLFYLSGNGKKGSTFKMEVGSNQQSAVYLVNGSISVGDQKLEKYSMAIFEDGVAVNFSCEEDSLFMILGGDPFPEERHIWWNFVSSDQEKIEAAKLKWKNREFDPTINETQFIPLPEQ